MEDGDSRQDEQTVPVIEEELVTGTRTVKTGSVRVRKTVQRVHRTVEIPTLSDVVEVIRKPVNQVVDAVPNVREEGTTLIIPVLEEEIVVQKRLVLKEEIHIRRSQSTSYVSQDVTIGREVAAVDRLDAKGNVVTAPPPTPSVTVQPPEPLGVRAGSTPLLRNTETLAPLPERTEPAAPLSTVQKGLLD